jgi:hypothetical protein
VSRRRRPKVGDVIQLELPNGRYAYGRVLHDAGVAFYRSTSDEAGQPPLGSRDYQFVVGVDDAVMKSSLCSVVGHDPALSPSDDWPPPTVINDILTGAQRIYHLGVMRPAAPGEGDGLEVAASWDMSSLVERLIGKQEAPDSNIATGAELGSAHPGDPFDNDAAAEWRNALNDTHGAGRASLIRAALIAAFKEGGYLEVDTGSRAVAAAAVVATQRVGSDQVSLRSVSEISDVRQEIGLSTDLTQLALGALARVELGESELRELWEESGEFGDWLAMIESIRAALQK